MLDDDGGPRALPPIRIVPRQGVYDYQAKYHRDDTRYEIVEDAALAAKIQAIAAKAHALTGCRDVSRTDKAVDLKRMMSRQASAEREKRATITKAEGDKEAALNLAAATTMAQSPGAMQLCTLQSLDGLGASPSNTVVLAVPVEVLELAHTLAGKRP